MYVCMYVTEQVDSSFNASDLVIGEVPLSNLGRDDDNSYLKNFMVFLNPSK
jgi:hypothetical protein